MQFSDEPEDPRCQLPCHRIGDTPPKDQRFCRSPVIVSSPKRCHGAAATQSGRHGNMGWSNSAPELLLAVKKVPLHSAHAGAVASSRKGGGRAPHGFKTHDDIKDQGGHQALNIDAPEIDGGFAQIFEDTPSSMAQSDAYGVE